MAFVTVYADHFRAHPIYPNPPFLPDKGWADLNGNWLDEGGKNPEMAWTDEEKANFLRRANRDFFWTSTYMNDYCNNITPENRPWPIRKVRAKKMKCGKEAPKAAEAKETGQPCKDQPEEKHEEEKNKQAQKESELMKAMREIFMRDKHRKVKKPIKTARRLLGYGGPRHYQTGISTYQEDIGYPGFVYMRDHLVKSPEVVNGRQAFSETIFY